MPDKKVYTCTKCKGYISWKKEILFKSAHTTLIRYIPTFDFFTNNQEHEIYTSVNHLFGLS